MSEEHGTVFPKGTFSVVSLGGIDWGRAKAALLFFGLICKGMALGEALPFSWGPAAKAVAAVIWPAFDGLFAWLLTPPKPKAPENE
jgi:hypothetical protein